MKHVFLVCNNMVRLMAMKLIAVRNIPEKDVIFLYNRPNSKPVISSVNCEEYTWFSKSVYGDFRTIIHSLFHKKEISMLLLKADESISEAVHHEKFTLYLPHSGTTEAKFLISHPLCYEFFFLEEGTLAYSVTPVENSYQYSLKQKLYLKIGTFLMRGRNTSY